MNQPEKARQQEPDDKKRDVYDDDASFNWDAGDDALDVVADTSDAEDTGFDPYNTGTLHVTRR